MRSRTTRPATSASSASPPAPREKCDRLAGVRFTQHLDSYRQFHEVEREKIKQRVIELLRAYGPDEKALIGKQAICIWVASLGLGNRLGQYASWGCVTGWRKRLACPIWRGKGPKAPAWTTDVLLRAWLLSLFSTDNTGGPRIQRRHWSTDLHERGNGSADRPQPRSRVPYTQGGALI